MPGKWSDEEEESSSGSEASNAPAGPPPTLLRRANKFEDEEEEDSDVLESWDADDSEVEREKAKKAEEEAKAKAKAAAEAAAKKKKSKGLRIADHMAERQRQQAAEAAQLALRPGETEAERRERLRRSEQEADLQHAADLFGDAGLSAGGPGAHSAPRKSAAVLKASSVVVNASDPGTTIDLSALPLMNPTTKPQFDQLLQTLTPVLTANAKKGPYNLFAQDLVRALCEALPSEQIKKINSSLTTLANQRLREEKDSDKSTKKTKAAKTKTTLAIGRPNTVDTGAYEDDGYGDDDFM